jgi:hypothetical protein
VVVRRSSRDGGERPAVNQLINGHAYSLQQEFSNTARAGAGGCLQHLGGTATPASPYAQDPGPLVYWDGSVMRTNTVHTIFWLPQRPVNATAPTVSGGLAVGKQLSTTTGSWTNAPTSFAYKWQRCDADGANCVTFANAATSKYTLVAADAGHTIRSEVQAHNSAGAAIAGFTQSLPTAIVVAKPAVTSKPTLSGTTTVGMPLSVSTGDWTYSPVSFTYKWQRCEATGGFCVNIAGATASSYTLKPRDAGHALRAMVTAKNAAGSASATTAPSAKVTK